ncbi:MAG: GGDEF domain-containing protein [Pseudomonadota bacterium]
MAVFRLLEGSYVIALVDALAVFGFASIAWLVYAKRSVRVASVCMAMVAVITAVTSVSLRGGNQVIWMYPATIALFYLLKPKEAAMTSVIAILAVLPVVLRLPDPGHTAIFLASLAVTISLSIAFAALTAEQQRELHAITLMDPLTGTGNRRAMDGTLSQVIAQAQSDNQPFVLMMLDLDHFKSVNDVHGHVAGDEVLREVAATIKANIRPTDSCFRAGGEEFVIVAAGATLKQASKLAERLRVAISETPYGGADGADTFYVTASLGLAEYTQGETRDALYKRADDALYEAKRLGRNRLHMGEAEVNANAA